jgi:hypothetical protein
MNRSFSKIRHIQESNTKLEKRTIKEQVGTSATDTQGNVQSLMDCFDFIKRPNEFTVGEPRPGDKPSSSSVAPGASKIMKGMDIEYVTDGGPEYRGIYLSSNGKRYCFTKTN